MIKAIIVDDEIAAREVISTLIADFCPNVQVVAIVSDTFEAEKEIERQQPDLVFLDVEMPKRSGIQFLQSLKKINFEVIFITAFDQYALQALKLSAVDYLLKPVEIKELIHAIHKVQSGKSGLNRVQNLIENSSSKRKKIVLPQADAIDFVEIDTILYCIAEGSYTRFVLNTKKEILVSRSIKNYEDVLIPEGFYRCHKSYIVNLTAVSRYQRSGTLVISNGTSLPVSRTKREEILTLISGQVS